MERVDEREDHASEVNSGHPDTAYRDELLEELSRLIDVTARSSRNARQTAVRWRRARYLFGIPAAVLAAVAGVTGLAATTGRVPAALLALAASGLGAAGTFALRDCDPRKGWHDFAIRAGTCATPVRGCDRRR